MYELWSYIHYDIVTRVCDRLLAKAKAKSQIFVFTAHAVVRLKCTEQTTARP